MEFFVMVYVVGQICEGDVDAFGAEVFFGVGVKESVEEFCFAVGAVLTGVEFVAAHFYLVVGVEGTLTLFLEDKNELKNVDYSMINFFISSNLVRIFDPLYR